MCNDQPEQGGVKECLQKQNVPVDAVRDILSLVGRGHRPILTRVVNDIARMVRVRYAVDVNLEARLCGARYLERTNIDQTFYYSLLDLDIPDIDVAHLAG